MSGNAFDQKMMQHALALAENGQGWVEPNPMVGCVIVQDGQIIAEGYHRRYGEAHAEVHALHEAGKRAKGSTVYVTLEPCSHYGKTPPCADALVKAGVSRVVCAMKDPYPEVSGRGFAKLESAGIDVQVGVCEVEARLMNRAWLKTVEIGLPWVISKWAQTVDGAIATQTGDSKWISNETSRKHVHELRSELDAIIVGIGTAVADDPMLTARDVTLKRVCRRVVIDPNLQLSETSNLVRSLEQAPLTVVVEQRVLDDPSEKTRAMLDMGVDILGISSQRDHDAFLNMREVLKYLWDSFKATRVLVEGGASTHAAFMRQRLVDEIWVFTSPKILGDGRGIGPMRLPAPAMGVNEMAMTQPLKLLDIKVIQEDILTRYLTK